MKSVLTLAASLLVALMMASATMASPFASRRSASSFSPSSSRAVTMASTKSRKKTSADKEKDDGKEEEKESSKKKSLWPFGGGGKSKESSDAEGEEKKEEKEKEKTPVKQGPFGIFRKKPTDEKPKKDDESKGKRSADKRKEKNPENKSKPESEESTSKKDEKSSSEKGDDSDVKDEKEKEKEDKEKEQGLEDKKKEEDEKEKTSDEDKDEKMDDYVQRAMQRQRQQQLAASKPSVVVYGQNPMSPQPQRGIPGGTKQPPGQSELVILSAISSLLVMASRYFLVNWILSKFQFDQDLKRPRQHFMWECLNDKFVKDDDIWNSVKVRPPLSMSFSNRKWNKIVKGMGPGKEDRKKEVPLTPSRTVVLIDLDTRGNVDALFANFAEMVSFLVGANGRNKLFFGSEPEAILNIMSGGGEVTSFALAAAQVSRLRAAGWKVTACVDRFAASGGYMIASQANLILAAPFATVGSIGVMAEGLNFFEALKSVGVQTISLKAGDMKNPITSYGKVTDKDIKMKQKDLEDSHLDFIELCRSRRPDLLEEVCNGRVLSGEKALETGMIDRILTLDEYVYEKISDGDLVMKIHLVSPHAEQIRFARLLQILPHFGQKVRSSLGFLSGGRFSTFNEFRKAQLHADSDFVGNLVKGVAFASMVLRAVQRSGFGKKKYW